MNIGIHMVAKNLKANQVCTHVLRSKSFKAISPVSGSLYITATIGCALYITSFSYTATKLVRKR